MEYVIATEIIDLEAHRPSLAIPIGNLIQRYKAVEPPVYMWRGMQEGNFGIIYGPSKSGKTTIAECLGLAIVSGKKKFLGSPIKVKQQKVLMISLEEYWYYRTQRVAHQLKELSPDNENPKWLINFWVVNENFPHDTISEQNKNTLMETIIESGAKIVFIDSLTRLYKGSIEDSKIAKKITMWLRQMSQDLGITLIVIHHTPKIGDKAITLDSLAGSRVIAQEADFLIGVHRLSNGTRYVKDIAYRYAPEEDVLIDFTISKNRVVNFKKNIDECEFFKSVDGRKTSHGRTLVCNAIIKLKDDGGIVKTRDLKASIANTGYLSAKGVHDVINELINEKLIKRLEGRAGVYQSLVNDEELH